MASLALRAPCPRSAASINRRERPTKNIFFFVFLFFSFLGGLIMKKKVSYFIEGEKKELYIPLKKNGCIDGNLAFRLLLNPPKSKAELDRIQAILDIQGGLIKDGCHTVGPIGL